MVVRDVVVVVVVVFLLSLRNGVEFNLVTNDDVLVCHVSRRVIVIGITNHNNRADTVMYTVVADAAETRLGGAFGGRAEATAAHDNSAEPEPLDLEAEPLLQVVVLHDVDFEGDLSLDQGLSQGVGLRSREIVQLVLELALLGLGVEGRIGILILGLGLGRNGGAAPVGAVEDAGGADVEEDDVVAGAEVVLDGPFNGVGTLVA